VEEFVVGGTTGSSVVGATSVAAGAAGSSTTVGGSTGGSIITGVGSGDGVTGSCTTSDEALPAVCSLLLVASTAVVSSAIAGKAGMTSIIATVITDIISERM
jgi:hypothetical protein